MHPVLSDRDLDQRDVTDLPDTDPDRVRASQPGATALTGRRPVLDDLIRISDPIRSSPEPGAPACLPGLRPLARRPDRSGLTNPSFDGGIEEFCEFIANRRVSSATCPVSTSTWLVSTAI